MEHEKPKLSAGELGYLWDYLMNNSLANVVFDYFYRITESETIRPLCSNTLEIVRKDQQTIEQILKSEDYPLPNVFTERDMNADADKPYTDVFVLFFLKYFAQLDLYLTAMSLGCAVRQDVRKLFSERMANATELYNKSVSLLLEKGLFVRSPIITSAQKANPEAKEGFLESFFTANPRPLTAREANELHKNVVLNHVGRSLLMAFHQSNKHPELKRLLFRGKQLASKIINEFSDILHENDLPVAMSSDTHVLDSTESPFSDRLIAYFVDQLNKLGVAHYGFGFAVSSRKDLKTLYTRIIADVYQYELDIKRLMIENQWLERPPLALDRQQLAKE